MKSVLKFVVVFFFFSVISFSQVKITLNAGGQLPTGDFKNGVDVGLGISGGMEYTPEASNVALSGEVGYNKFTSVVNIFGSNPDITILKFTGGIRYFIKSAESKIYPYLGANLGLLSLKFDGSGNPYETAFIFAPQAGVRFQIAQGGTAIDVNVQYNYSSTKNSGTISWFGANAGIAFAL